ncbi:phosphoadenosine phosphosulfate reductase [compost metagenome]
MRELPRRTGGPEIEWVKADFTAKLAKKREYVARVWPLEGVPMDKVERALALLHPTGNPFLDLCLWKTRFPSSKTRFCTDELKLVPMFETVQRAILEAGDTLISWQGVRHEESIARRDLPMLQRINPVPYSLPVATRRAGEAWTAYAYRPLVEWREEEVFAFHRKHSVPWNPLYDKGMKRVGCFPCVMVRKEEMLSIATHFPEHVDKIEAWEALVTEVAKKGRMTFFNILNDPLISSGWERDDYDWSPERVGIRARVEWSKTSRGGLQYDGLALMQADFNTSCNQWGACE